MISKNNDAFAISRITFFFNFNTILNEQKHE